MKKLTSEMLRVLRIAERDGGAVIAGTGAHKGHVERVNPSTVTALIQRGLLQHIYGSEGNVGGRLTDRGRAALEAAHKTPAQLDTEIAETLAASKLGRQRLHPVEGLQIPADARAELIRFWRAHPALRKGCLDKYGFDPIDQEADYWHYGLAEPDHAAVLRAVQRAGGVFSLANVKHWQTEELKSA